MSRHYESTEKFVKDFINRPSDRRQMVVDLIKDSGRILLNVPHFGTARIISELLRKESYSTFYEFETFLSMELGVSVEDVSALLLGGHGDSMVPLPRYAAVGGIPVTQLIPKERLDQIVQRARDGGAEIVNLLKTGSAYYAPGAAVVQMVEAILRDKKRLLPCAAYCDREYSVGGYFVGVPVILGTGGVEKVIEVELDSQERAAFDKSVAAVKELVKGLKPS